jgi:predicted MFS family arabinose efflux permease
MSLYMVAFRGGNPLGSLTGGWLATLTNAQTVLMVNGMLLSAVAVWFLMKNARVREL